MPNPDEGHIETDAILEEIEDRLRKEYREASAAVEDKLNDYLRRFSVKDAIWLKWVHDGLKTLSDYKQWRTGQIMMGNRWQEMRDTLAQDYKNVNNIARSIVRGYMPEVYALNHNFATFQVEHDAKVNTSYTLYDRHTVERLLRSNPQLLPSPGKRVSQRIRDGLDVKWNRQQIQSVMLQSVLQGDSIPEIAKRLSKKVGDANLSAAIRNARTMTTGAQNAGRVDSYKRAEAMGIEMQQRWVAVLDSRTRHSHRMMDGELADVGKPFSNGCYYPGDPSCSDPGEYYNCRCTLIAELKGFERDFEALRKEQIVHDPDVGKMTYEEWKKDRHSKSRKITYQKEKGEAIRNAWIGKYRAGSEKEDKS